MMRTARDFLYPQYIRDDLALTFRQQYNEKYGKGLQDSSIKSRNTTQHTSLLIDRLID